MSDGAESIETLMDSCRGMIVSLARKYFRPGDSWISLEELVHEARVSVWKSAMRWQAKEAHYAKFSTYAWNRIRHDLYLYICQTTGTIYVPRQGNLERRKAMMVHTVSLDEALTSDGFCRHDFIAQDQEPSLYSQDEVDNLRLVVATLDDEERWLIGERFGNQRTLASIAEDAGVTMEAIRQREVKTLKKIRQRIATHQQGGKRRQ